MPKNSRENISGLISGKGIILILKLIFKTVVKTKTPQNARVTLTLVIKDNYAYIAAIEAGKINMVEAQDTETIANEGKVALAQIEPTKIEASAPDIK